jgi:DNA modification methylase
LNNFYFPLANVRGQNNSNMEYKILQGDCVEQLKTMEAGSVHTCVTSPPYFNLRDYQHDGQIGLEETPEAYVAKLVEVFREVRRVLRDDGTVWLNLGDSYAGGGMSNPSSKSTLGGGKDRGAESYSITRNIPADLKPKDLIGIPWRVAFALQADGWYLRQDIIWAKPNPMPESVTDRCTKAHEYIFLLSKKPRYYYDAEAVKEKAETPPHGPGYATFDPNSTRRDRTLGNEANERIWGADGTRNRRSVWTERGQWREEFCPESDDEGQCDPSCKTCGGNGLVWVHFQRETTGGSIWRVATQPYSGAHFATFPPDLIRPCIQAGCPKECCAKCGAPLERVVERTTATPGQKPGYTKDCTGRNDGERAGAFTDHTSHTTGFRPTCSCNAGTVPGTVVDPFGGSGTTAQVAIEEGRNAVIIELNPEYVELAHRRIRGTQMPLF